MFMGFKCLGQGVNIYCFSSRKLAYFKIFLDRRNF